MAKIKLTIQELKRQKTALKRFQRYLPTLTLKKLQLQIEINRVKGLLVKKLDEEKHSTDSIQEWKAVMGEGAGINEIVRIEAIEREIGNVAGVEVPILKGVRFSDLSYDLYIKPTWIDQAVDVLQRLMTLRAEILTLRDQIKPLEEELRTTIQRVNLFEKIKIPETQENIRVIQIFLGDQQTAAVVRGKIAKSKVAKRALLAVP